MDEIKKISTKDAPAAIGPYSQAIVAGDTIYLSGQIGLDPKSGQLVEGGIAAETKQVLENLKAVLQAGGSDISKVVSTNVYLADMNDFAAMNEVYAGFFKEPFPARATVAVKQLPKNVKLEISAIAMT
ncbi:MAG: RidA family protein [Sedimentisphaerales bacterium]|nr:RidA family protein [Sedimentisphaerales bacterium]